MHILTPRANKACGCSTDIPPAALPLSLLLLKSCQTQLEEPIPKEKAGIHNEQYAKYPDNPQKY